MSEKYTECYCSQEIDENSTNCCTLPITICEVCERKMCQYHADTFGHLMTCRTPKETESLMRKHGLI